MMRVVLESIEFNNDVSLVSVLISLFHPKMARQLHLLHQCQVGICTSITVVLIARVFLNLRNIKGSSFHIPPRNANENLELELKQKIIGRSVIFLAKTGQAL